MIGTPLVITLGQLLSLGVLVCVIGVVIWLWGRSRKAPAAFLGALPETGNVIPDARLQEEISSLRIQVTQLRQEVEALKASRPAIAPNYTQAIDLARQGQSVAEVANRCGISRAEAELIVAMHSGKDRA